MTGNRGINRLAQALDARTKKQTDAPSSMDLGVIGEDGSLRLDQFTPPIPPSGYLVAEWTMDAEVPQASRTIRTASPVNANGDDIPGTTSYSPLMRMDFAGGDTAEQIPKTNFHFFPALQPGDRVLVFWVHGEPVIISKVVSGNA